MRELPITVEEGVAIVSAAFRSHGGGIALEDRSEGAVTVTFTGACSGCLCRQACLGATVEPALRAVPGIERVHATGVPDSGTQSVQHAPASLSSAESGAHSRRPDVA